MGIFEALATSGPGGIACILIYTGLLCLALKGYYDWGATWVIIGWTAISSVAAGAVMLHGEWGVWGIYVACNTLISGWLAHDDYTHVGVEWRRSPVWLSIGSIVTSAVLFDIFQAVRA
jgi:hypothetical protein